MLSSMATPSSILVVDGNMAARRCAIIRETVEDLAKKRGNGGWANIKVETFLPSNKNDIGRILRTIKPLIVLVILAETKFSKLADGRRLPRVPCESIMCGYEIIAQIGVPNDVYFVARDDNISGVDVMSILLSGARGIIDLESLGSTVILKTLLDATKNPVTLKKQNRLLVGRPYKRLEKLLDMTKNRLTPNQWNLLLALAEIPCVPLKVNTKSGNANQTAIALEVSRWWQMTGYRVTDETRRHIVSVLLEIKSNLALGTDGYEDDLDYEFEEEDEEDMDSSELTKMQKRELPYLPLYARMMGLPSRLLPIRGLDETLLASELFKKGINGMHIKAPTKKNGIVVGEVTMRRT